MSRTTPRSDEIRRFILDQVDDNPRDIARLTAETFGISRQAVNRHIQSLMDQNRIDADGNTRNRHYAQVPTRLVCTHRLSGQVKESDVWRRQVQPVLAGLSRNVIEICEYGFTEIFNNLLDHSHGSRSRLEINRTSRAVEIVLHDNGVGIFTRIQRFFKLQESRDAAFELSEGKLTTDPARHSGEGIFFTSRMFDQFSISSNRLKLLCHQGAVWQTQDQAPVKGTTVRMVLNTSSSATRKDLFDRFSSRDGDYTFCATHVPVALARYTQDEDLISRSQAKRVLSRVEEFREACLDFYEITFIGQAFADEMFRVFARRHPRTKLSWIHTAPEVKHMIHRALHHDSTVH